MIDLEEIGKEMEEICEIFNTCKDFTLVSNCFVDEENLTFIQIVVRYEHSNDLVQIKTFPDRFNKEKMILCIHNTIKEFLKEGGEIDEQ